MTLDDATKRYIRQTRRELEEIAFWVGNLEKLAANPESNCLEYITPADVAHDLKESRKYFNKAIRNLIDCLDDSTH